MDKTVACFLLQICASSFENFSKLKLKNESSNFIKYFEFSGSSNVSDSFCSSFEYDKCFAYQYNERKSGAADEGLCTIQLHSAPCWNVSCTIDSNMRLQGAIFSSQQVLRETFEEIASKTLENMERILHYKVDSKPRQPQKLSKGFLALCVITFIVLILATIATTYDQFKHGTEGVNELLMSFSIRRRITNLISLDQKKSADAINCLHGIKAISVIGTFYLHAYFYRVFWPLRNRKMIREFLESDTAAKISGLNILVEFFLVISALLFTRSMLKALDS